eukprot:1144014-Pelagomonas_calceolata.AAC.1
METKRAARMTAYSYAFACRARMPIERNPPLPLQPAQRILSSSPRHAHSHDYPDIRTNKIEFHPFAFP